MRRNKKSGNFNQQKQKTISVEERLFNYRNQQNGCDNLGGKYNSFNEMWAQKILQSEKPRENWYNKSEDYWKKVSPTVNGMLGGLEHVSNADVEESEAFLKKLIIGNNALIKSPESAIDVGAGIGRVTQLLLSKYFSYVDLLEFNPDFLLVAKNETLKEVKQARNFICSTLQDHIFHIKYDIIWIQWVIIYLSEADFIIFFSNCRNALNTNGLIIVKDNLASSGFVLDLDDSSITRSEEHLKLLFEASGLKIIRNQQQLNFPQDLFAVKMFALAPI